MAEKRTNETKYSLRIEPRSMMNLSNLIGSIFRFKYYFHFLPFCVNEELSLFLTKERGIVSREIYTVTNKRPDASRKCEKCENQNLGKLWSPSYSTTEKFYLSVNF